MNKVKVWDPLVRIFHWTLVAAFTISYLTGEEESDLHVYSGYLILGLLVFRFAWGFIGTRYARFWNFFYSPATTLAYLRDFVSIRPLKHYLGHNPAGAAMVFALLFSLSMTVFTGLKLEAAEGRGPLAAETSFVISAAHADDDNHRDGKQSDKEEFWEEVHEFFANFTLLLVFAHIGGVLLSSARHRENLIKSMWTGIKEEK